MYLLAIDLGTSSVKTLLVSAAGQVVARASANYPIYRPKPGRAEQSPDDWWQATMVAVQSLLAQADGTGISVSAIGLSGQMHGTVLLGKNGHLLGPAIIWPDQRSSSQAQEITELIGSEHLIAMTGSPVTTGFQAATIRWIQQEQPQLWQEVETILLPKDYIRWHLTGTLLTEPSDGSGTLLFDVHQRDWSSELLNLMGIDLAQLPSVRPSQAVSGQLGESPASELGLRAGIPIIAGAADTACSLLGAAVTSERELLLTISTAGQIVVPSFRAQADRLGRVHTFCSALIPGKDRPGWYQLAAILSAGMALRWLRDNVFGLSGSDAFVRMTSWAETATAGSDGLLFLPYLAGERSPHMDPYARGLLLGLMVSHGRAEIVRSVMEGVAMACYDAYSVLSEMGAGPERIIMAGGGASSPLWRQIVADVFDMPVHRLAVRDQSAMGAALLAGEGIGLFDSDHEAETWASYESPVEPDGQHHSRYQELLVMFRAAYRTHRNDYAQLHRLGSSDESKAGF